MSAKKSTTKSTDPKAASTAREAVADRKAQEAAAEAERIETERAQRNHIAEGTAAL